MRSPPLPDFILELFLSSSQVPFAYYDWQSETLLRKNINESAVLGNYSKHLGSDRGWVFSLPTLESVMFNLLQGLTVNM